MHLNSCASLSQAPQHTQASRCLSNALPHTVTRNTSKHALHACQHILSTHKHTTKRSTDRDSSSVCCATQGDKQQQAEVDPLQGTQQQQQQQQGSVLQLAFRDPPTWPAFLGTLFQQGALLGTLLDGIHSRVQLQEYDLAPITLGPLHTSLLVPPLLGTFYVVLALLTIAADNNSPGPATAAAQQRASDSSSVGFLALNFGVLAASLALSADLYSSQQPSSVIFGVLAAVTLVNWAVFDRTKQGLGLAALCGLGAPAAEVVLMAVTHCWHYPRADVAGVFVSWVPWCYAFYTPAVSNLARYLWATCRAPEEATSNRL